VLIEPSVEHGADYIDFTRELADRWRSV